MNSLIFIMLLAFISISAAGIHPITRHHTPKNVVEDVNTSHGNISCWEKDTEGKEPRLSKPIYRICHYIQSDKEDFLGGLTDEEFAGENMEKVFTPTHIHNYAVTVVCSQDAFIHYRHVTHRPEFVFRCVCTRNGCNVPGGMDKMLQANKHVLPRHH